MKTLCTYVCIYTHKKWLYICIFMIHSLLRTALRTFAHSCLWMTICWILDFFRKSVYIFKSLDMNPTKNSPVKLAACWSAVTWPSLSKAHPYTRFLLWRTKKLRESTCMWAWNEYPGNQKNPQGNSRRNKPNESITYDRKTLPCKGLVTKWYPADLQSCSTTSTAGRRVSPFVSVVVFSIEATFS